MNTALSEAQGSTAKPLLETTIGEELDRAVERLPNREALVDVAAVRRWTYLELRADVDAVASALLADGIGRGDRVGVWATNCAQWAIVQYATAKIGAILVTLNPAYRVSELVYALDQSRIRRLFATSAFKTSDYRAMVAQAAPDCPALEGTVFIDGPDWHELLDRGRREPTERLAAAQAALSPDDPINIQYTSGTTGSPKGATLSHRNILNNGYFAGELLGYTHEDRICAPVPYYHCFGMVLANLAAVSHGACVVLPSPSFDPAATLKACSAERCTSLYGVPTMFIAVLAQPDFADHDLSFMRTGLMSGAPCPVEVMKQVTEWAPEVAILYGMTETSPGSTQTRADDSIDRRVSTVGRPHPHVQVKIVDAETGEAVPRGISGELCVKGYSVMLRYWDDEARTAEAIDTDGWMHTGDIAMMDDEGYVSITGRIKDMIIRGGENIYPREIEEFLYTHPDVLDAQVVGVPDHRYGEEVMAFLRLRDGAGPVDAAAVREFSTGRLAHFKIPRYVHCVDEFPLTPSGKVRKNELREQAADLI